MIDEESLVEEKNDSRLDIEDLEACTKMLPAIVGEIVEFYRGKVVLHFVPNERMIMDDSNTIHAGFVFNAASYAAMAAINKKNSVLIASDVKFLAPIELGHEMVFKAEAAQIDSKKCEVKVEGFLLDIKIFDSIFHIAIFDKKIFKLRFKDNE